MTAIYAPAVPRIVRPGDQDWDTARQAWNLAVDQRPWGVAFPVKPGYDDIGHRDLVDKGSRWAIGTPGEAAPEAHGEAGFGSALDGLVDAKLAVARQVYAR